MEWQDPAIPLLDGQLKNCKQDFKKLSIHLCSRSSICNSKQWQGPLSITG